MNKIWQAVGIVFALNIALLGFAFLYENTFAQWGKDLHNADGRLKFITLTDILTADTAMVNEQAEQLADKLIKEDTLVIKKIKKKGVIDSAFLATPKDTAALENKIYNAAALDNFFEALINEKDNTLLRIAHYGDSQLEGDRVTHHIRRNLQAKFGGSGIGYVPLDDVTTSPSYTRTNTGTWDRYNVFNNRTKNGYYGLSGCVFRFSKAVPLPDSTVSDSLKKPDSLKKTDSIIAKKADSVKPKKLLATRNASVTYSFAKGVSYDKISLMYGRSAEPFEVRCYTNAGLVLKDTIEPELGFGMQKLNIPAGLRGIKIEFVAGTSPDIYGLQVDGGTGITVDNYAIRGHSGDGLFRINSDFLAKQIAATNTRLIIFQYGANMIPYLESEKECKYYEDMFYRLFKKFRDAAPNASILVIGNGDMGYKKDGEDQSYPYSRCLNTVQKDAALRAGCAFWSLMDAMGGTNSILTWTRKGLASLDGHLSPKGQEIMANLIFKGIMVEYNNYILKQENETVADTE